jgi:NADH-quinone oxidoreductase subunit M
MRNAGAGNFFPALFLSLGAYDFYFPRYFHHFLLSRSSLVPKFLLIGIWGSGKKEYSAMKLALMHHGRIGPGVCWPGGLYFNTGDSDTAQTFDLLQIGNMNLSRECNTCSSLCFYRLWNFRCLISLSYLGTRRPFFRSYRSFHVSCRHLHETGGYGCLRVATYLMPMPQYITLQ